MTTNTNDPHAECRAEWYTDSDAGILCGELLHSGELPHLFWQRQLNLAFAKGKQIGEGECRAEIERLQKWVNDLQSGMYINCVYCGHQYGPREVTPVSMADVLKEHIRQCPLHPLSAAEREINRLTRERDEARAKLASFEIADGDDVPEYATAAYDIFEKGISWAIDQLQSVLGVKEWATSGGGTETLDGDVRAELHDLLKAAGRDDESIEAMTAKLAAVRVKLEEIVCTEGIDAGVVMLSSDSPTRPSLDRESGEPCRVYVHEYFSPLGDALVEAWRITDPQAGQRRTDILPSRERLESLLTDPNPRTENTNAD